MRYGSIFLALWLASCGLDLDPAPPIIQARFDPEAGVIPMPNDVLRDEAAGHLDPPVDDPDLTGAERQLYQYLSGLDGWSSAAQVTLELTGSIDARTVDDETVQIWQWGVDPRPVAEARVSLEDADTRLVIDAPRNGWERGGNYVVMVRGGASGVRGRNGETVECDAAFYFLRLARRLDDPKHQRAFPGATRDERMENARKLEEIREQLQPYFAFFEERGVPRADMAALWTFTVTEHTELAMDQPSQRMPIPFDLLIDPESGEIDLPQADWDSELEREAKTRLHDFDGFALSADGWFELTAPVDPASVTESAIELWELGGSPAKLPATVRPLGDGIHVMIRPDRLPLAEQTSYAIVVRDALRDAEGNAIAPMPIGHLMRSTAPIARSGRSEIGTIDDEDAVRLERTRARIAPLLDLIGRDGVVTAWPFTTMTVEDELVAAVGTAERLSMPTDPVIERRMTPGEALADFALGVGSIAEVDTVYEGVIRSPDFLDPVTRGFRDDDGYEVRDVAFTMTIPKDASGPVPVVLFGHGIMTERRFVLAIADALARKGFAAIAIDQPYHGTRTHCVDTSPVALVDPRTGDTVSLPPCEAGAMCSEDGRCVDASGEAAFAQWPVLNYPVASGAAYLELETLPRIKDHFEQSLIDLGALVRSLERGDWRSAVGVELVTDRFYWVGQSLGGIIGATFVPLVPEIERAVLNVPGSDLVDMFDESVFFGPQVDGYFTREGIDRESWEGQRFLNIARWFMDSVDPASVAHIYRRDARQAFIQMASGDIIIPNDTTRMLADLGGIPLREYVLTEHGFLAIPLDPAYLPGTLDMAAFLSGELTP